MFNDNLELKNAFYICWLIFSIAIVVVLLSTIFINPDVILAATPTCTAKLNGSFCFMCGTTRAFVAIGNFKLNEAYELNKFSVLLYFIFIINSLLFFKNLSNLFHKKRNLFNENS